MSQTEANKQKQNNNHHHHHPNKETLRNILLPKRVTMRHLLTASLGMMPEPAALGGEGGGGGKRSILEVRNMSLTIF